MLFKRGMRYRYMQMPENLGIDLSVLDRRDYTLLSALYRSRYALLAKRQKSSLDAHMRRARDRRLPAEFVGLVDIARLHGWGCAVCGVETTVEIGFCNSQKLATVGHIIPMARGGGHTWGNVQIECRVCNTMRSDRLLHEDWETEEWEAQIAAHNDTPPRPNWPKDVVRSHYASLIARRARATRTRA